MTEWDNTNSGALFKNENKTNDNQPTYRGPLNVNGEDFELAAWVKTSKAGKKFMSLKVSPPYQKDANNLSTPPAPPASQGGGHVADESDDLPFSPWEI